MTDPKNTEATETVKPATTETVKDETATTEGEVSDEDLDGVAGAGITTNFNSTPSGGNW